MTHVFLPCAAGVEPLLADEVARITGVAAEAGRGGVFVDVAIERGAFAYLSALELIAE